MTIQVYLCEKFHTGHERKAFGRFLQEMIDRYGDSDDDLLIIGEPEANTASMDLIVLSPNAFIVVELKELTLAEGLDGSEVTLSGTEKGAWHYTVEGIGTYPLGGSGKKRNPYQQVKNNNYLLRDWLLDHTQHLPGGSWTRGNAIKRFYSWVVISPGYNREKSNVDLPWDVINKWFKLLSIDELAWEVETAVNPDLEFTSEQMIGIATQMGASRRDNLREFVPNYVPPSPNLSFFTRPPVTKNIMNRDVERTQLLECYHDSEISIIHIGGPSGIGKTYLAAWLVNEVNVQDTKYIWIDCRDRDVTHRLILSCCSKQNGKQIPSRFDT